jgi:hypothetical protein
MAHEVVEIEARCRRGHPAFELEEVLDALREPGRRLHWAIEKLYAVGRPALLGRTMWQLGNEITRTPGGLRLTWDELEALAAGCFQVVDARIVGSADSSAATAGDVVVEVECGRRWRITAEDRALLDRCRSLENAPAGPGLDDELDDEEGGVQELDDALLELDGDQTVGFPC